MNHNTILITRPLSEYELSLLRARLHQIWPGERWTIRHGQMDSTESPLRRVGPQEYKGDTITSSPDSTTTLRFGE